MRILKYVFLLLVLGLVALTVYVATQKGEFSVTRSVIIDVPRQAVFSYVNDQRNFASWSAWKEDHPDAVFRTSDIATGKGSWSSWEAGGGGKLTSIHVQPGDSITQKAVFSDNAATSSIRFKDTLGKTKVTWHAEGSVDFMTKVNATFNGGVSGLMGDLFERSLEKLKKTVAHEINTFSIKVNGIAKKQGGFYLKQSTTCRSADVNSRISTLLSRMEKLFRKQKMAMTGKPFILYDNVDYANRTVTFSVCFPLKEEIFVAAGSDIAVGFLDPLNAVKVTLTGDYSHRKAAIDKAFAWMKEKGIAEATALKRMDIYVKGASDTQSPSKWITEILIPTGKAAVTADPAVESRPLATDGAKPSSASSVQTTTKPRPATAPTGSTPQQPAANPARKTAPVTPAPASTPETQP